MPVPPVTHINLVFAQNLLVARLADEWTQQGLAGAAGLSRATVAQLEAGTGDPKLSTLEQLARALSISPLLLLLGGAELAALAHYAGRAWPSQVTGHASVSTMRHLVETGSLRSRLEATNIGVHLARRAGLADGTASALGAAIGSFHLPGNGTLAGAQLGGLLASPAPAPRQLGPTRTSSASQ